MAFQGPNDPQPTGGGGGGDIGAIVAAGAAMLDNRWNRKAAEENTDKTIAANKAEAELAYQRQVEFWHQQNMYNSPEQQMARFGAAGLNPHLIYGQGNAGNSSGTPQYNPPSIQHRYAAAQAGPAVQAGIGTLMAVGSWMQNMRLTETEIESKKTGISKAEQLIDYLRSKNPKELQALDNRLSLFPYQRSQAYSGQEIAMSKSIDLMKELQYKWGNPDGDRPDSVGGTKRLDYLKKAAETRLKEAQASWTDYDITNPQAIIQMVLGGVMSMAGMARRAPSRIKGSINPKARRVKTFYQDGKRRSQVVDY